jgi:hypothetical protein
MQTQQDSVGAGRYIMSFLMLGPVGLLIQYLARDYGWRGMKIIASIWAVWIVLGVITVASRP